MVESSHQAAEAATDEVKPEALRSGFAEQHARTFFAVLKRGLK